MAKHSKNFPPSASKRWLTCQRSVSFINSLPSAPARQSSVYAAQGTVAHDVGEQALNGDLPPPVGMVLTVDGHAITIDREMIEAGETYSTAVHGLAASFDGVVSTHTEVQVDLDPLVGAQAECMGTCDALVLSKTQMGVVDLKYGRGIEVDVEDNSQLQIYALGALLGLPAEMQNHIEHVTTMIVQPRIPGGQLVKTQTIYALDLLRWGDSVVKPAIERIMSGEADTDPFVTSDECRFCPAAAHCPALKQRAQDAARKAFSSSPLNAAADLSDSELSDALNESEVIQHYIDAVATEALLRAKTGKTIPGRKLVAKRGVRRWIDENLAELNAIALGAKREDLFTPPTLKSPAQVALLVDKASRKGLTQFSKVVSSGVSLVRDSDPRPAVAVESASDAFTTVDTDDDE